MKNIVFLIAVVLLTALFSHIQAQPGAAPQQPFPPSNAEHLRHLKKELKLDDKQADKVKDILKASQTRLKDLRDRMEAAREKDMEEMDKILDDQDKQISNVLNDTQKKQFEDMKDKMPRPEMPPQPPMRGGRPGGPEGRPGPDDMPE